MNGGKYADTEKVVEYLGNYVAKHLLQFHAITGCDTTSYFYRVGKISVFKKVLNNMLHVNDKKPGVFEIVTGKGHCRL